MESCQEKWMSNELGGYWSPTLYPNNIWDWSTYIYTETCKKPLQGGKNSMLMVFFLTPYLRIRLESKESKEIDPFGRGKFAEIRRRSCWPIFLPMSSRVRSSFSGLPCSRSGWSVRGLSMTGDSVFGCFFIRLALMVQIPLCKRAAYRQTDRKRNWS